MPAALGFYRVASDAFPDSKVHGANMEPTWVLSAPDGSHIGPMNLAIRVYFDNAHTSLRNSWEWTHVYIENNNVNLIRISAIHALYKSAPIWC